MADLKERLAAAASSSADRIAAFDAAEQGTPEPAAKPKPKPAEKRGTGTAAHSSVDAAKLAQLRAKFKALAGKPKLQAKIAAQIKAIQDAK